MLSLRSDLWHLSAPRDAGARVDTAGEEKGYLVRMTDDTLVPPYQLQPGHNVTIVSKYDASEQHYGKLRHEIRAAPDYECMPSPETLQLASWPKPLALELSVRILTSSTNV